MATIKFSITYKISKKQIDTFIVENEKLFKSIDYDTSKSLATQILGVQMLDQTLTECSLKAKDFKSITKNE